VAVSIDESALSGNGRDFGGFGEELMPASALYCR
jgi:hypothetical protein